MKNLSINFGSATDVGQNTTYTEEGLTCDSVYTRYIWAYNDCGDYSSVAILNQSTLPVTPAAPTPGTHIPSSGQIVWNWYEVTWATGYKWNSTDDYNSATDMGTEPLPHPRDCGQRQQLHPGYRFLGPVPPGLSAT
jgi:hypothetical protein